MSNERDSGRYDAFTDTWVNDNVRVDFAWGNIPMQPDDDRGENTLDPALDSHIIAASQYEGFPAFITGDPYDDTTPNTVVPDVIGLLSTTAKAQITNAGLNWSMTTTATGATAQNNNKIKSQSPTAGTVINLNDNVSIVAYAYVAPVTTGPVAGINRTIAGTSFSSINGNQVIMYVIGQTVKPTVGWTISLTGTSNATHNVSWVVDAVENNNSYNTGGTAVLMHLVSGTFTGATSTGGTWTKL